ncbi:hypothetical protein F2Q70_00002582 [Brassica cretica]|uniref:Derlin n=1 Tax=Brassica cretica TaxID=69181 RepID=A0A8S9J535_BRACR|nr:hypothetical protein F2Q70_00002582 [Brassica cretica]
MPFKLEDNDKHGGKNADVISLFPIGRYGSATISPIEFSLGGGEIRMAQGVEEWYKQMPIITRSYLTAAVVTTVGCSLDIISPYSLYLNPTLVVKQHQYWRLVTNFLYFRKMVALVYGVFVLKWLHN